jgi:hypothetical protein
MNTPTRLAGKEVGGGTTMAASSCYQGKLRELAAIIKGTAKPL